MNNHVACRHVFVPEQELFQRWKILQKVVGNSQSQTIHGSSDFRTDAHVDLCCTNTIVACALFHRPFTQAVCLFLVLATRPTFWMTQGRFHCWQEGPDGRWQPATAGGGPAARHGHSAVSERAGAVLIFGPGPGAAPRAPRSPRAPRRGGEDGPGLGEWRGRRPRLKRTETPSQGVGECCPGLGRARGGEGAPRECASDLHVGITRLHS